MPLFADIAGYRPLASVPDELVDDKGVIRPHWQPLISHLQRLTPADAAAAQARADQYLMDSGVFYRQYGSGQSTERPWPLSHMPVVIAEDHWTALSAALVQRAHLLEALMADL